MGETGVGNLDKIAGPFVRTISAIVNPDSSEKALREQIRSWLEEENGLERLRETAIAQRGLAYHREGKPTESDLVLVLMSANTA